MYNTEILLLCFVCFGTLVSSAPADTSDDAGSSPLDAACHVHVNVQQVTLREDKLKIEEHIMYGGVSAGLIDELRGLEIVATSVKAKITDVYGDIFATYRSMPIDTPSMTCGNITEYLVAIYGAITNATSSLDAIQRSNSCFNDIIAHVIQDGLAQLSQKSGQTICAMTTNGLYNIANVSSVPIGPYRLVSSCADPTVRYVPAAEVFSMIYQLSVILEQTTKRAYDDIFVHRYCIEEISTMTISTPTTRG